MKAGWILKAIVGGLLFVAAMGFATMFLWNHLAVTLFSAPTITFIQALGLLLLGRLLTGGFGGRGWHYKKQHMHNSYMKNRWNNMSEEERNQIKARWGKYGCGSFPETNESKSDTANGN